MKHSILNKIYRVIWNCVYIFFFRFTPIPLFFWRSFILRLFCAKIGGRCHIYPKCRIWAPYNLVCGDYSCIANDVEVYNQGKIVIGKNVVISQGGYLCSATHNYTKKEFPLVIKKIFVEDNVWIAAKAFIHPGVRIGTNAIVSACSVVKKDVPPNVIVEGFPAKVVKKR